MRTFPLSVVKGIRGMDDIRVALKKVIHRQRSAQSKNNPLILGDC